MKKFNFEYLTKGLGKSYSLTPMEKCGVILLAFKNNKCSNSLTIRKHIDMVLQELKRNKTTDPELLRLGIRALGSIQSTDVNLNRKLMKSILLATDQANQEETAMLGLEFASSVASDDISGEDSKMVDIFRNTIKKFPKATDPVIDVIKKLRIESQPELFGLCLKFLQIGQKIPTNIVFKSSPDSLSSSLSLEVMKTFLSLEKTSSESITELDKQLFSKFELLDEQSSKELVKLLNERCDAEKDKEVIKNFFSSPGVSSNIVKEVLTNGNSTVKDMLLNSINRFDILSEDAIVVLLENVSKEQLESIILKLIKTSINIDSEFWLNICEQKSKYPFSSMIRLKILNYVLENYGMEKESYIDRFATCLRTCENEFSDDLVSTWKAYYSWSNIASLLQKPNKNNLKVFVNSLLSIIRSSMTISEKRELVSLSKFLTANLNEKTTFSILQELHKKVAKNDWNEHLSSVVLQWLNNPERTVSETIQGLTLCVGLENEKIIQTMFKLLETSKEPEVFKAVKQVLDSYPEETEKLDSATRTDLAQAKRLLLFAPKENAIHNIKPYIASLASRNLLKDAENQPLALLVDVIKSKFPGFSHFGANVSPVVTTSKAFDDLLIPLDHVSRKPSDTFYLSETEILRPHTSAHQTEFLGRGFESFLLSGDVYRRDEIDRTHFPVFHQMEGVKVLPPGATDADALEDLKTNLNSLIDVLFPNQKRKWVDAYFPFTNPSLELEVEFNGKFIEILGCGVMQNKILSSCNLGNRSAWAFGLGLERLAMILFSIPDIRLFWSDDVRYLKQFENCRSKYLKKKKHVQFKSFSKYPPTKRDISMWITENFEVNDFYSIVREVSGDVVEEVVHIEDFTTPEGKTSKHFRIAFRSDSRTVTGEEANKYMNEISMRTRTQLKAESRTAY